MKLRRLAVCFLSAVSICLISNSFVPSAAGITENEKVLIEKQIVYLRKEVVKAKSEYEKAQMRYEKSKKDAWRAYMEHAKGAGKTKVQKVDVAREDYEAEKRNAELKQKYLGLKDELENFETKLQVMEA